MVEIVKGGNMKLINALTGKVMKVSNPKPNPKMVTEIILAKLGL
jgi:Asp-tRNA(Asn)/Glu-tRNA(Gln) amidotransferase B subunit